MHRLPWRDGLPGLRGRTPHTLNIQDTRHTARPAYRHRPDAARANGMASSPSTRRRRTSSSSPHPPPSPPPRPPTAWTDERAAPTHPHPPPHSRTPPDETQTEPGTRRRRKNRGGDRGREEEGPTAKERDESTRQGKTRNAGVRGSENAHPASFLALLHLCGDARMHNDTRPLVRKRSRTPRTPCTARSAKRAPQNNARRTDAHPP
ncbi:hypothetical protein DFH09DRAFT_1161535 [Mycena vulgaris]|nr:hypothetical protein DFH09DRAFT_1161535 [Mycena vulgaris]